MAAIKCACPKCHQTLHLAQALPARVKCPKCEAVFTLQAPATAAAPAAAQAIKRPTAAPARPVTQTSPTGVTAAAPAVVSAPLVAPPRVAARSNKGLLIGLAAGAGVLLIGSVALAVVLFASRKPASPDNALPDDNEELARLLDSQGQKGGNSAVNKAVQKGVNYLRHRLLSQGQLYYFGGTSAPHVGAAALTGLTLLECDVPPSDQAVVKAAEIVREARGRIRFTYTLALSVLFLDRLTQDKGYIRDERDPMLIRSLALQMIAAQQKTGGWGYECQLLSATDEQNLANMLAQKRFRPGSFVGPKQLSANYHDNSIAQFATLALWAARRHGVLSDESLIAEEQRYRNNQQPDGNWTYNENVKTASDATTCAGLIGLAIGHGVRVDAAKDAAKAAGGKGPAIAHISKDPSVTKGLAYLSKVIGKTGQLSDEEKAKRHKHTQDLDLRYRKLMEASGPALAKIKAEIKELDTDALATGILFDGDAWGDLYLLWSIERVAVIYGMERGINGKDWYAWGSKILLQNQQEDGSWQERFPGVPDTCFALLFLRRANIAKDLTDKLVALAQRPTVGAAPPPNQAPAPPGRKDP